MLSKLLTRREQLVILFASVAIVAGSVALLFAPTRAENAIPDPAPEPQASATAIPISAPNPDPAPEPIAEEHSSTKTLTIAVRGSVRMPGVYELPGDATVNDAIFRAGGATDDAELLDINLAAPLRNSTTLTIPRKAIRTMEGDRLIARPAEVAARLNPHYYTISGHQEALPTAQSTVVATAVSNSAGGLIDLNRADAATLEKLPGIGPVLAAEIIDFRSARPFTRIDDLIEVRGIGPKKLEDLRPLVTVHGNGP